MALSDIRSQVRGHPFLALYLGALILIWLITIATWTISPNEPPNLHPIAQALQYVLVLIAGTLAALRLRVEARELRDDAVFGFYGMRWSVSDDIGGQAFWTAIWVGAVAMLVNVILLIVADLLLDAAAADAYPGWVGSAIAAGALLGMFSALIALGVASVLRRRS